MPEPDLSRRLLNMGAGSREEGGLGSRKQNAEDYDKAVGGPTQSDSNAPKATPPQHVDKINSKAKFGDRKNEDRNLPVSQWAKPLASFKHGTNSVPKTGNYTLHKGEAVVPKEKNKPDGDESTPSYKHGTDYVPKTGPAILHKGEKVTPEKDNMDPMALVPGRSEEKPKKVIHEIRTRKAKTGFIHEHHHTRPEHHKMDEHTSPDVKGMLAHMGEHMGDGSSDEAVMGAGAPPAAGSPPAGAPPVAPAGV
jgi:hypothetical protein